MYANEKGCFILEKTLSVEEKLRRAEEIYQKRKNQEGKIPINTVNIGNKPDFSLLKKTFLKLLFCMVLYFLLYFVKNSNYFFSQDLINKINEILSYDMNVQQIYNITTKYLENFANSFQNFNYINNYEEKDKKENEKNEDNNVKNENTNKIDNNVIKQNKEESNDENKNDDKEGKIEENKLDNSEESLKENKNIEINTKESIKNNNDLQQESSKNRW